MLMCPIPAGNHQVKVLLFTTVLFAESAILQACYIAACAVHAAAMHMPAPGYATQSACKHSPCRGTSYCLGFEFSFDCWSIRSNTAITATLVFPICMYIYMEHALAMHACVHERVLH